MSETTIHELLEQHQQRMDSRRQDAALARWHGPESWLDYAGLSLNQVTIHSGDGWHFANWNHPLEGRKTVSREEVAFLQQFIEPGDLVLDIGAHAGDTTVPMALAAGPGGLCCAYEPNRAAFGVLCVNAWLNQHVATIHPFCCAVMPEFGEYTFHYSDSELCNGGYAEGLAAGVGVCGHTHEVRVSGRTLIGTLKYVSPGCVQRLSYCKLDTEGMDAAILAANADFFREYQPVIKTEMFPGLTPAERETWYATVTETLGYAPFWCHETDELPFANPYDLAHYGELTLDEVQAATGVIDALCFPKEA